MELWAWWLIAVGVLLIIEVLSQMMWAMCLAIGCIVGCVCSLCGLDLVWQTVLTAVAAVAAYIFLVPLFQRWHAMSVDKKGHASRTGMEALLGRHAVLQSDITPGCPGRGQIDGDSWQMRSASPAESISAGTEVTVVGHDSIILLVNPKHPNI